ncbi:hypothetical protein H9P43_009828 [Blastocladiella emersonii ATCC 22665]|nr:hypothetical protein H9P43_009828 [Blastocladiella emersonii ATCC 22665]
MSSAYGAIAGPKVDGINLSPVLAQLRFPSPTAGGQDIAIARVEASSLPHTSPLFAYLQGLLNAEIAAGNTYPQEHHLDAAGFAAYFLSAAAFLAVLVPPSHETPSWSTIVRWDMDQIRASIAGTFYIKPNYPGRCSMNANGGFIVAAAHRGRRVGRAMALAYLRLAKALGYRASVFNLVFVSNDASVRLWRSLGFQQVGRIPKVGRLLAADGKTEELTDAFVMYYDLSNEFPPLTLHATGPAKL